MGKLQLLGKLRLRELLKCEYRHLGLGKLRLLGKLRYHQAAKLWVIHELVLGMRREALFYRLPLATLPRPGLQREHRGLQLWGLQLQRHRCGAQGEWGMRLHRGLRL